MVNHEKDLKESSPLKHAFQQTPSLRLGETAINRGHIGGDGMMRIIAPHVEGHRAKYAP